MDSAPAIKSNNSGMFSSHLPPTIARQIDEEIHSADHQTSPASHTETSMSCAGRHTCTVAR